MRKRENRKLIPVIRIAIFLLVIGLASTIFALFYAVNPNIIANVKINNVEVSGLSRIEVEKKFEDIIENIVHDEIVLAHGEYEQTFTLKRMELETDIIDKIFEACTLRKK